MRPGELPEPDYFTGVCEEVVGEWLRERGFFRFENYCSDTMSAWRRGRHFLRFSYWPRDAPRYPVMVGMGVFREGHEEQPANYNTQAYRDAHRTERELRSQPAMPNGRCRMHGGKSQGAPKGNKNAFRHGFRYTADAIANRRETAV